MDPMFLILGFVVLMVAAVAGLRSARKKAQQSLQKNTTPERAQEVSELFDTDTHKAVYTKLAQNDMLGAAQLIKQATGRSNMAALTDAMALRQYPQVRSEAAFREVDLPELDDYGDASKENAGTEDTEASAELTGQNERSDDESEENEPPSDSESTGNAEPTVAPSGDQDLGTFEDPPELDMDADWSIPQDWMDRYGDSSDVAERHMNFTHNDGETERSFSTQDIPDAQRDQLMAKIRDGRYEEAATIIAEYIDLDQEMIRRALEANRVDEGGESGVTLHLDVGDGRHVTFSTEDLTEAEQSIFMLSMRSGDIDQAVSIFMAHTGLEEDQARGVLAQIAHRYLEDE